MAVGKNDYIDDSGQRLQTYQQEVRPHFEDTEPFMVIFFYLILKYTKKNKILK
jgi:hypothetical protein